MRIPAKLLKLIKDNKKFLIVSHVNPEGDALGSCLALAFGLKKMKKSVSVLSKCPVPEILRFLPGSGLVKTRVPSTSFDVLFLVDCNTLKRTGFSASASFASPKAGGTREISPTSIEFGGQIRTKTMGVIDHHLMGREKRVSVDWIDPGVSSAGELVYKLLKALRIPIDKKIATNLYTAISTDTGGFRYSNTGVESLQIASRLVEAGANPWEIAKEVYESIPLNSMKLLALAQSTLEQKNGIACITVTQQMLKKTNTSIEDTENLVDYPRKIRGIKVAIFFREDSRNIYKISLRSKSSINVEKIARKFGGGGHASAAGCMIKGSLKDVRNRVFRAMRNAQNKK